MSSYRGRVLRQRNITLQDAGNNVCFQIANVGQRLAERSPDREILFRALKGVSLETFTSGSG